MRIIDKLSGPEPCFSFEFFPPKTAEGERALWSTIGELADLGPGYASVTYGAGGSTREGTVEIAARIQDELGIDAMAHLSCVGETVEGLRAILHEIEAAGIENVLALRGDPPRGEPDFAQPDGGLGCAAELAALISAEFDFGIAASCFPEVHREAVDLDADLAYLKSKVEAGAEFLITQLFFDNSVFWRWQEQARAAGIDVPILIGLMPVTSYEGIKRFCAICDATIPEPLAEAMDSCGGDVQAETELGIAYAARQCEELLAGGVPGIHFYTLNRPVATRAILKAMRAARPWQRTSAQPTGA